MWRQRRRARVLRNSLCGGPYSIDHSTIHILWVVACCSCLYLGVHVCIARLLTLALYAWLQVLMRKGAPAASIRAGRGQWIGIAQRCPELCVALDVWTSFLQFGRACLSSMVCTCARCSLLDCAAPSHVLPLSNREKGGASGSCSLCSLAEPGICSRKVLVAFSVFRMAA